MNSDFKCVAIPADQIAAYVKMNDTDLAAQGGKRMIVDKKPGYPCRISLRDAEIGETVILFPFRHHAVDSPYQATGPVFIAEKAVTAEPGINEIPLMLRQRLLSVRAYDAAAMMVGSKVVEGNQVAEVITGLLSQPAVEYLHIHNAGAGCFNCKVVRV